MYTGDSRLTLAKRSRRPATRVRTGCTTCKVRRIKCDEERPFCKRCTSTGRKCDGYIQSPGDYQIRTFTVDQIHYPFFGVSNPLNADDNVGYLEFYHHCAGATIASTFDKQFWRQTPLQIAQSELCVRHALIALSYLNKTETGSLKEARSGFVAASQPKTLLYHYNKAVRILVRRISEASYSPEVGLVCCLIFICIEFLRGNYDTAFAHYRSGLNIIAAYRRDQLLSPMEHRGSTVIEETLIPMFARMLSNAIIHGLPSEQVFYISDLSSSNLDYTFTSVQEAQVRFYDIQNAAFILVRNLGTLVVVGATLTKEDLYSQQANLQSQRTWYHALEKFERDQKAPLSEQDVVTVNTLKAYYYCLQIFITCLIQPNQTMFDQHLDGFKAVVHYARIVLDTTHPANTSSMSAAANFTFENGLILPLYLTACRCRCPVTRREAIALLERNPPREGLWDAQQHAAVAKRIIELEEAELDPITGWPVERTRIWSTIVRGDMDGNGRFVVFFAIGLWGEGRGIPPLPPGMKLSGCPDGRMWSEWFVL